MANNADLEVIQKSKRRLGQMEAVLGNDQTIASLVNDILDHYENYRENMLTGKELCISYLCTVPKAMIAAYSRAAAMKIYKRILEFRPGWTEKAAVVMTENSKDPEEWRSIIGNKRYKDELAKKFKDNDSPLKIAIVVDMWLTGFDVPSMAAMYVYKPMQGYNLIHSILQSLLKASLVLCDFSDIRFKADNFNRTNMLVIEKKWDSITTSMHLALELAASFGFCCENITSVDFTFTNFEEFFTEREKLLCAALKKELM